jgi:branched-chain amino acid transport system substrate-binding protein
MMSLTRRHFGTALASLAAMTMSTHIARADKDTVKIGVVGGFTGPQSAQALPALEGIRMAVSELNAAGGFEVGRKKFKFELIEEDNQSKPELAVAATRKILTNDDVPVILCSSNSVTGLAVANVVKLSNVVMIGDFTAMGTIAGTPGHTAMFRSLPDDQKVVSKPFVNAVVKELDVKKIAFVLPNDETSRLLVKVYEPAFKAAGAEVTGVEYFQSGTLDFAPVLRRLQNRGLDSLFVGYTDSDVAPLIRQSLELGSLPTKLVYRGGSGAPAVGYMDKLDGFTWQILSRDMENPPDQKVKDFVERYKKFTGNTVASNTFFALGFYDTIFVLAQALHNLGKIGDSAALAAELKKIKYSGIRNMYYDEMGMVHSDFDIGIVRKNGKPYSIPVAVQ